MGFSIIAMWQNRCPKCRKSSIFTEPFAFSDPLSMPDSCPICGQRFEPEPGFYYGAMFLSYIVGSFMILLPTLLLVFYFKWSVNGAMAFAIFIAAVSYFKLLRGSRSLWLHLMVRYDPILAKQLDEKV